MKRTLISLATCALVLSACTSGDILEESPQSNAIAFRNVVSKPSRSLDGKSFNQFFVYGYYTKGNDLNTRFNIFTDTPVSKSGDGWASAIQRYWVPGASYSFYAFSCENLDIDRKYGGASVDQYDGTFRINYTTHATGGTSHDLIFASATGITGQATDNAPVPMSFKHILSKVSMRFQSDFPEGYQVEITNIEISDFENTGTFVADKSTASSGIWMDVDYDGKTTNSFKLTTIGNDNVTKTGEAPVESSECYMIPHTYESKDNPVKIKFNIKLINPALAAGSQVIASNTLTGSWHPKWRVGTQYVYTIHLSGDEAGMDKIEFNVGLADWNEPEADNIPEQININLDYKIDTYSEE